MELNSQHRTGWIFVYSCVFGFSNLKTQCPAISIFSRGWLFATLFSIQLPAA